MLECCLSTFTHTVNAVVGHIRLHHCELLTAAAALVGTGLVYPGWNHLYWGLHLTEHPRTYSGMGDVYTPWAVVPVLTTVIVVVMFLTMRTYLMRGEDPFHHTLWVTSYLIQML